LRQKWGEPPSPTLSVITKNFLMGMPVGKNQEILCIRWMSSFAKWTKESACGADERSQRAQGCSSNQTERDELGRVQ
jgi:hypothetical protein